MVLTGKRKPSTALLAALCADLGLGAPETEYISLLYISSQAKNRGRAVAPSVTKRIAALRKRTIANRRQLSVEEIGQLSDWLIFVIKQLARTPGFQPKLKWIQRRLRSVESSAIETTLQNLENLGILKNGKLLDPRSIFGPIDISSAFIRRHHLQMMRRAEQAIHNDPLSRREIISYTFNVNEKDLPRVKDRLRTFLDDFEADFDKDGGNDIGQLNLQFFLHT
jgi:uncharacterized protein (TIGR02147 family)